MLQTIWVHLLNNAFTSFFKRGLLSYKTFVTFHNTINISPISHSNFFYGRFFREEEGINKTGISKTEIFGWKEEWLERATIFWQDIGWGIHIACNFLSFYDKEDNNTNDKGEDNFFKNH